MMARIASINGLADNLSAPSAENPAQKRQMRLTVASSMVGTALDVV